MLSFQRPPVAHLRIDMIRYLRVRCGNQMSASSQRPRLKKVVYLPTCAGRATHSSFSSMNLQSVSTTATRSQASIASTRTACCLLGCPSCNPQPAILGPPHSVIPSSRLDANVSQTPLFYDKSSHEYSLTAYAVIGDQYASSRGVAAFLLPQSSESRSGNSS